MNTLDPWDIGMIQTWHDTEHRNLLLDTESVTIVTIQTMHVQYCSRDMIQTVEDTREDKELGTAE